MSKLLVISLHVVQFVKDTQVKYLCREVSHPGPSLSVCYQGFLGRKAFNYAGRLCAQGAVILAFIHYCYSFTHMPIPSNTQQSFHPHDANTDPPLSAISKVFQMSYKWLCIDWSDAI